MKNCSRREMIGSMAAALAGTGLAGVASAGTASPSRSAPVRKMTGKDLASMKVSEIADHLFSHMDCSNFTNCHKRMREEHGIWIPELVPVFHQLDVMRWKARS